MSQLRNLSGTVSGGNPLYAALFCLAIRKCLSEGVVENPLRLLATDVKIRNEGEQRS